MKEEYTQHPFASNIGSSFNDFLKKEGIFDEVIDVAIKRVILWQVQQESKVNGLKHMTMTIPCSKTGRKTNTVEIKFKQLDKLVPNKG